MRRDTQIGIILGVVILVVIGVFLSTRSTVEDTDIPDLILADEDTLDIEEIDINELIKESKTEMAKETLQAEDQVEAKEEIAKVIHEEEYLEGTPADPSKDGTALEGKWEGIAQEITEEAKIAQEIKSDENKITSEAKQQITSDSVSGKVIHKVQSNENLFKISRKYYGDENKWNEIYEANKDNMLNPNELYIGQELLIPEIKFVKRDIQVFETPLAMKTDIKEPPGSKTHTIQSGDTLYSLARKYYDDSTMWYKIYNANEYTIEDKSLLITGQVLIIPE